MSMRPLSGPGSRRRLVVGVLVAVLAITVPFVARAADGFTSPLIIPAADFESTAVWNMGHRDQFSDAYGFVTSDDDDLCSLMAPVYLPHGATITRFEAAMTDLIAENPSSTYTCPRFYPDVEVDLMSNHLDDNIYPQDTHVVTHASLTSTLDTGQLHIAATTAITEPYVNNLQQMYWVRVYVCGVWQGFQGVRIHYEE